MSWIVQVYNVHTNEVALEMKAPTESLAERCMRGACINLNTVDYDVRLFEQTKKEEVSE